MHIFMYKNCSRPWTKKANSSLSWRYTAVPRPNVLQPMVLQNSGSKLSNPLSHIYETYRNKDFVKLQTIFPSNIRESVSIHSYSNLILTPEFIPTPGRTGHVPTFLKPFCSVLEQGPSAKLFRSRSSFLSFRSVLSRRTVFPFRSVLGVLSWRTVASLLFCS